MIVVNNTHFGLPKKNNFAKNVFEKKKRFSEMTRRKKRLLIRIRCI